MRSSRSTILTIAFLLMVAVVYQSCDTTLNIEKPATFLKYLGGDGNQTGVDMVTDADGNIYVLGSSIVPEQANAKHRVYVVRTNSGGNTDWQQTYGDVLTEDLEPVDIELLNDGSVAILANRKDAGNALDFVIYILNKEDGTMMTVAPIVAGEPGVDDHALSLTQIYDGFLVSTYRVVARPAGSFKTAYIYRFTNDFLPTPKSWGSEIKLLENQNEVNFDVGNRVALLNAY